MRSMRCRYHADEQNGDIRRVELGGAPGEGTGSSLSRPMENSTRLRGLRVQGVGDAHGRMFTTSSTMRNQSPMATAQASNRAVEALNLL